ncbi:hypothetical protein LINPERHAP1_LOCUS39079 [Linum perenne]
MSLALIQSYSSAEDEENPQNASAEDYIFSDEDEDEEEYGTSPGVRGTKNRSLSYKSVYDPSAASNSASGLPSAFDAFSEVSRPPQFLNNSVEENGAGREIDYQLPRHGRRRARKERKELPAGFNSQMIELVVMKVDTLMLFISYFPASYPYAKWLEHIPQLLFLVMCHTMNTTLTHFLFASQLLLLVMAPLDLISFLIFSSSSTIFPLVSHFP